MTSPNPRGGWLMWLFGALVLALATVAVTTAINQYGQPLPGALVGPDAVVSDLAMPDWDGPRRGLHYPDRLIAIGNHRLDSLPPSERGLRLSQVVRQVASRGGSHLTLDVRSGKNERQIRVSIARLGGEGWWLLAGSLFFSGALFLVAGFVAFWASPGTPLSRTFATLASLTALFFFTLFDYHTSYRLVPVFLVAFAMLPGTILMLAFRLPDDTALLRRAPWLGRLTTVVGIAVAGSFVMPFVLGQPMPFLRVLWPYVLVASLLFFVVTCVIRYLRATGHRRDIMRVLAWGILPPIGILSLLMATMPMLGWPYFEVLVYPTLSLIPVTVAFAFVRYDLWGSRMLLSRVLTRLVVGGFACLVAMAAAVALTTALGVPFRPAVVAATVSGVLAAVLVLLALHLAEIYVFPSRAQYKPTIEQLSADLISYTSPDEVARAIERTLHRWLPCEKIHLALDTIETQPLSKITGMPAPPAEIPSPADAGDPGLVLPVVFAGAHLGVLKLGGKPGGALFTSEDLDLLGTVVNQGALALAHARAYQELDHRRKEQVTAWRREREALVQTVAAEISHEIRYPLNFFRSLLGQAQGRPLSPDDLHTGREEVERLERLLGGLRRMTAHRLQRRPSVIRELCARAELLLRDALGGRRILLSGDPEMTILCDPDHLIQILVNLLANALQATEGGGQVGVAWEVASSGPSIQVWDDGPGFVGDPSLLFAPWYTTKANGTGLGLAITHRLVRTHGWSIEAKREGGCTRFTVMVPSADAILPGQQSSRHREYEVS